MRGGATYARAPQANNFKDCAKGDVQSITVAGSGCTITKGQVRNLSRQVHWTGQLTSFSNTVLQTDHPGEHSARFNGEYTVPSTPGGSGGGAVVHTWSFNDDVEIDIDHKGSDTDAVNDKCAAPVVNYTVTYETYDVTGANLVQVWNSIQQNGPGRWAGVCVSGNVGWEGTMGIDGAGGKECPDCGRNHVVKAYMYFKSLKVTGSATIKMPKWTNSAQATAAARAEWIRFLAALKVHEDGHFALAKQYATDSADAWKKLRGIGWSEDQAEAVAYATSAFNDEIDVIETRLWDALDAAQDAYDSTTRHGATQKATLDTAIN